MRTLFFTRHKAMKISKDSFASKKSYKGRRLYYKARLPASVGENIPVLSHRGN